MKYDTNRQLARNRKLVSMRREHPDWPWQEIADWFGISRQRAKVIYDRTVELEKQRT